MHELCRVCMGPDGVVNLAIDTELQRKIAATALRNAELLLQGLFEVHSHPQSWPTVLAVADIVASNWDGAGGDAAGDGSDVVPSMLARRWRGLLARVGAGGVT